MFHAVRVAQARHSCSVCLLVLLLVDLANSERPEQQDNHDDLGALRPHNGGPSVLPGHLHIGVSIDVSIPGSSSAVKPHAAQALPQHAEKGRAATHAVKATAGTVAADAGTAEDVHKQTGKATDYIDVADAGSAGRKHSEGAASDIGVLDSGSSGGAPEHTKEGPHSIDAAGAASSGAPEHMEESTDDIDAPDAGSSGGTARPTDEATDDIDVPDTGSTGGAPERTGEATDDIDAPGAPMRKDEVTEDNDARDAGSSGAAPDPEEMAGIVMADAGSSGTKLFTFSPYDAETAGLETGRLYPQQMKVLSHCSVNASVNVLRGISALSYEVDGCNQEVEFRYEPYAPRRIPGTDDFDEPYGIHMEELLQAIHPDEQFAEKDISEEKAFWVMRNASDLEDFAPLVLQALKIFHEHPDHCGKSNQTDASCPPPMNGNDIPILATAGMRHLTKEQDQAVWENICGRSISPHYRFAERGMRCGTISGTQEALYEFVANIAIGHESTALSGTFSIGGKSAQLSIPLKSQEAVQAFQQAIQEVDEFIGDCENIRLPNDEAVNILSPDDVPCSQDFIKLMNRSELLNQLPERIMEKGRLSELEGLGLVSFLGLFRLTGGVGIAGGSDSIEQWAKGTRPKKGAAAGETRGHNGTSCGASKDPTKMDEDYNFVECKEQFMEALQADKLFQAVKKFFHGHHVAKEDFVYSVKNAIPHYVFETKHDGSELALKTNRIANKLSHMEHSENYSEHVATGHEMQIELEKICGRDFKNMPFGWRKEKTCMKALFGSLYITEFFTEGEDVRLHFEIEDWSSGLAAGEGAALLELGPAWLHTRTKKEDSKYLSGAAILFGAGLPTVGGTAL